jgi:hypothetical protein
MARSPEPELVETSGNLRKPMYPSPLSSRAFPAVSTQAIGRESVSGQDGGCWLWPGARNRAGYGEAWVRGRSVLAHRWNHEQLHGPLPAGVVLHHACHQRACVRPDHLMPMTPARHFRVHALPALREWHARGGLSPDQRAAYRERLKVLWANPEFRRRATSRRRPAARRRQPQEEHR